MRAVEMAEDDAFQAMLEGVLETLTLKVGRILGADRASIFLVDKENKELWLKVAQGEGRQPVEVRIPMGSGIAGHVATTGETLNVPDPYGHPLFNADVDRKTGYQTRSILCVPIYGREGDVFAVAQLLNKNGGEPFLAEDQTRFREFIEPVGVIFESWLRMIRRQKHSTDGGQEAESDRA
jgi:adenylate cyclase